MYRVAFEENRADPFATSVEAEQAHIEMVDRVRELETAAGTLELPSPEIVDRIADLRRDITEFEARLVATGARLPEGGQRSLAQGILDFWALRQTDLAALVARHEPAGTAPKRPEPPTAKLLADYDERTAVKAAMQAEECFAGLPDDAARDAARRAFLAILKGTPSLEADEADAIRRFAEMGVVSPLPTDIPGPEYGLEHEALPQAWRALADWQQQDSKAQGELERIRSSAQAWEDTKSVYELPRGQAVEMVNELAQHDSELRPYAAAAIRRQRRDRLVVWGVVSALIALAGYALFATLSKDKAAPTESQILVTEAEASRQTIVGAAAETAGSEEGGDTAQGSKGWIWLGSAALPLVTLVDSTVADPGTLARGTRLLTRANLKIREAKPADDGKNIAGERIGQVSGDVAVELLEAPTAVNVDGVDQFWGQVRVVPAVYIQLGRSSQFPLAELKRNLANAGFDVQHEERLERMREVSGGLPFDVRYYYEQDEAAARRIANIVARSLGSAGPRGQDTLLSLAGSPLAERVKTGTVEVWLYQP